MSTPNRVMFPSGVDSASGMPVTTKASVPSPRKVRPIARCTGRRARIRGTNCSAPRIIASAADGTCTTSATQAQSVCTSIRLADRSSST